MRERAVSGERKISASSAVAATAERKYNDSSAESAVVCAVFVTVASSVAKRFFSSVQRVASPSAYTGMARSPVHSSISARSAAASLISWPTVSRS